MFQASKVAISPVAERVSSTLLTRRLPCASGPRTSRVKPSEVRSRNATEGVSKRRPTPLTIDPQWQVETVQIDCNSPVVCFSSHSLQQTYTSQNDVTL